jgi:hypothetical protein
MKRGMDCETGATAAQVAESVLGLRGRGTLADALNLVIDLAERGGEAEFAEAVRLINADDHDVARRLVSAAMAVLGDDSASRCSSQLCNLPPSRASAIVACATERDSRRACHVSRAGARTQSRCSSPTVL